MAMNFKVLKPEEFYARFVAEKIRPDGRKFMQLRKATVNVGSITTANGSALVKVGNTTVLCGVKAEFAKPKFDSPGCGYIVPNVELSALCSYRFRPGPPCEQAQICSQYLADIINSCNLINLEDLCIVAEKLVWVLYVDAICLDYDGNVQDACCLAMLAALNNAKLPKVEIDEEREKAVVSKERTDALIIRDSPISTTFTLLQDKLLVIDPTSEEEDLSSGYLTIVTSKEGDIVTITKLGGRSMTDDELNDCMKLAVKRGKEMRELLDIISPS